MSGSESSFDDEDEFKVFSMIRMARGLQTERRSHIHSIVEDLQEMTNDSNEFVELWYNLLDMDYLGLSLNSNPLDPAGVNDVIAILLEIYEEFLPTREEVLKELPKTLLSFIRLYNSNRPYWDPLLLNNTIDNLVSLTYHAREYLVIWIDVNAFQILKSFLLDEKIQSNMKLNILFWIGFLCYRYASEPDGLNLLGNLTRVDILTMNNLARDRVSNLLEALFRIVYTATLNNSMAKHWEFMFQFKDLFQRPFGFYVRICQFLSDASSQSFLSCVTPNDPVPDVTIAKQCMLIVNIVKIVYANTQFNYPFVLELKEASDHFFFITRNFVKLKLFNKRIIREEILDPVGRIRILKFEDIMKEVFIILNNIWNAFFTIFMRSNAGPLSLVLQRHREEFLELMQLLDNQPDGCGLQIFRQTSSAYQRFGHQLNQY